MHYVHGDDNIPAFPPLMSWKTMCILYIRSFSFSVRITQTTLSSIYTFHSFVSVLFHKSGIWLKFEVHICVFYTVITLILNYAFICITTIILSQGYTALCSQINTSWIWDFTIIGLRVSCLEYIFLFYLKPLWWVLHISLILLI